MRGHLRQAALFSVACHGALAIGMWTLAGSPRSSASNEVRGLVPSFDLAFVEPLPEPAAQKVASVVVHAEPDKAPVHNARRAPRAATEEPAKSVPTSHPSTDTELPPEAAQAAQARTADEPASAQMQDAIVSGAEGASAGGLSAGGGTQREAVSAPNARVGGGGDGQGTGPVTEVDRSRAAALVGGTAWHCPLPEEADEDGIEHAVVALEVTLSADGKIRSVRIMADPGHGFAREAERCARRRQWLPALDKRGSAMTTTQRIHVRF